MDNNWVVYVVVALSFLGIGYFYIKGQRNKQLAYIKDYHFHHAIKTKLLAKHPQLTADQLHLVFRGLRDYFFMCNCAGKKNVAMPSRVVDDAWHEFILFTRSYKKFCRKSLGRFLHHTPTEAMASPTIATEGIKRAWRLACAKERIDAAKPNRMPLIFAIDGMLSIEDGFTYAINCQDKTSSTNGSNYCAGHIGCASGCAGDSGSTIDSTHDAGGFFDNFFDSDGGGCGGGCGGD